MTKFRIMLLAVFAVLAFGAIAAQNALALGHMWLNLAGELLTKAEPALTDGEVLLHHKIPSLLGGGEVLIKCDGEFHGTVGPNSEDLITSVLELTGGDGMDVHCEVEHSTNTICPAKELVTVLADNLPWKTMLLLLSGGSTIYDHIFEDGKGEPGYETTCKSIKVLCAHLEISAWDENETTGALFLFRAEQVASCSDGGTGTVLGHGVVLDFFLS